MNRPRLPRRAVGSFGSFASFPRWRRVTRVALLALVALAAPSIGCKPKVELTCRWITLGSDEANLKGEDPVRALTPPWTTLGVKTDKATVCESTPTEVKILYKDRGDWSEAFHDLEKSLESKGYKLVKLDDSSAKLESAPAIEATLERASDKTSLLVRVSAWPKDVWKQKPYDLSVSQSPLRAP